MPGCQAVPSSASEDRPTRGMCGCCDRVTSVAQVPRAEHTPLVTRAQTAALLAAAVALALVGCSDSEGKKQSPHQSLDVGARVPFSIWTHCGVRYTSIDGVMWQTRDGQVNPRPEYPEYIEGTIARVTEQRAVFTGRTIPIRLIYHPAPDAQIHCQ
jgi:hypothetical protein